MSPLQPKAFLTDLPAYVPGKSIDEVREALGLECITKLASNEHPLGPSPKALETIRQEMVNIHRYPAVEERDLCRRLAAFHGRGLTPEHFFVGNGGADVLRILAHLFLEPGTESISGRLSFPLYPLLAQAYGAKPVLVEPRPDYGLDLEAMLAAVNERTRVVWLCSPNNPTGLPIRKAEFEAFLDHLPDHVLVVLDEAYFEYATDPDVVDSLDYVTERPNVVGVRSFSKVAGLASLRVGYAVAPPDLVRLALRARLPFNTGGLVLRAAAASLEDQEYLARTRRLVAEEREFLRRRLGDLGLHVLPSQANFVLVTNPPGGQAFADRVLKYGYIIRPAGEFGAPEAVRITVGTREQNEGLVAAIQAALEEARTSDPLGASPS